MDPPAGLPGHVLTGAATADNGRPTLRYGFPEKKEPALTCRAGCSARVGGLEKSLALRARKLGPGPLGRRPAPVKAVCGQLTAFLDGFSTQAPNPSVGVHAAPAITKCVIGFLPAAAIIFRDLISA